MPSTHTQPAARVQREAACDPTAAHLKSRALRSKLQALKCRVRSRDLALSAVEIICHTSEATPWKNQWR